MWQDPWLSCEAPLVPIGPHTLSSSNLLVSDLLCKLTNGWDLEKIRHKLPQYENAILKLITSSATAEDQVAWLFEKSGSYSTRSGYGAGMERERAASFIPIPFDWKKSI